MISQAKVLGGTAAAAALTVMGLAGWSWNPAPGKGGSGGGPSVAMPAQIIRVTPAQPHVSVSPYEIARWDVQYRDAKLGLVSGKGFIDWKNKRARVELADPRNGAISKLHSRQFDVEDTKDHVRLVL